MKSFGCGRSKIETRRIGVFGLHPCAGTTHLTILAASYFSHFCRKRTEVREMTGRQDFAYWERYLTGQGGSSVFRTRRCVYRSPYSGWEDSEDGQAEIVLCDLGHEATAVRQLLSCDEKWIIAGGGIFHEADWGHFFSIREVKESIARRGMADWLFLVNHGDTGKKYEIPLPDGNKSRITAYGLGTQESLLLPSKAAVRLFQRRGGAGGTER